MRCWDFDPSAALIGRDAMRHSHVLTHKEWALVTLNGVARSHRTGGRGRHRAKPASAIWAWERTARSLGASDEEVVRARELTTRLRY